VRIFGLKGGSLSKARPRSSSRLGDHDSVLPLSPSSLSGPYIYHKRTVTFRHSQIL
jgi:hypothetical protein